MSKKGNIVQDIEKAEKLFEQGFDELTSELAKDFHALLISNIQTNKYGFSLNDKTVMRRLETSNSNIPLINTGEYISKIAVEGSKVYVMEGTTKSGISFAELSNILEYGRKDKRVPAFPVWRLTYEEFLPQARNKIQKRLKSFINKN